jgi:hypothetical protein
MIGVPVAISSWKRAAGALGLACAAVLVARPVRVAATIPAAESIGLDVPAEPTSNPLVVRLVSEHPGLHVLRSIVADVDGDGDLDVVVSTVESPLALWINDGTDHFTRRNAGRPPALGSEPSATVRALGPAAPGLVGGSKWRHALAASPLPLPVFPMRTAVRLDAATRPTIAILASSPSRAPPSSLSA